jgi:hypothetical protein
VIERFTFGFLTELSYAAVVVDLHQSELGSFFLARRGH